MNIPSISPPYTAPCGKSFKFSSFSKHKEQMTRLFIDQLTPTYGSQKYNLRKFEEKAPNRRCEIMTHNDKPYGMIAYLDQLQKVASVALSFEVRNLLLIRDTDYSKNYQAPLLKRLVKLAADRKATHMHFLVPKEDGRLIDFLKTKGFTEIGIDTISSDKKEALIFSCAISNLEGFSAVEAVFKEKKRKRDDEEEIEGKAQFKKIVYDPEETSPGFGLSDFKVESSKQNFVTNLNDFASQSNSESLGRAWRSMSNNNNNSYNNQIDDEQERKRLANYDAEHKTETAHYAQKTVTVHNLPMKGTQYLDAIKSGIKRFEGRVNAQATQKIRAGHHLKLFDHRAGRGILCEVLSRKEYNGFREMLMDRGVVAMLPQLADRARMLTPEALLNEGVRVYERFPGSQRVHQSGCVAIEVKFLKDV